jgi:hypothetical protein
MPNILTLAVEAATHAFLRNVTSVWPQNREKPSCSRTLFKTPAFTPFWLGASDSATPGPPVLRDDADFTEFEKSILKLMN